MTGTKTKEVENIEIRDMVFGDMPLNYWANVDNTEQPWSLFKEAKKAIDQNRDEDAAELLRQIIAMPGLESRQYLQAYYFLNELGLNEEADLKLYGVVAEVAMDGGIDLLAVYADHSARYYHVSGGAIIWEQADDAISNKVDHILSLGEDIVPKIGPWNGPRPAAPINANARINFLTSKGLHFGEADQRILFKDPMAGKLMYAMVDMMETLIDRTQ